ncbi:TadE/TadG family type IV pilus assembly protein [Marimonas sp. MJW-29]|uniref:TadE/TadG family type IV pilus assembly protein n=1 Tax=Sulfitobacter sediminis TaxID=3234186 RepID=A0ABV3RUJ7_9RHOB
MTHTWRRLGRDERGTQLVEFAVLLPMLLLVFAVIIEGGRLMWSYQAAAAGVRDATRYLSRSVPSNICDTSGSVSEWTGTVAEIVRKRVDGNAIFPSGITIDTVSPSLSCGNAGFRVTNVGVVSVRARLTVTFPMAGLFTFAGQSISNVTTSVTDSSRVFGT